MLRTIPALSECDMIRTGYAIEYDFLLRADHAVAGDADGLQLFAAGQLNETTGYEEAAAQGLIAESVRR